ncbi:thioredoxin family protein [Fulvivirga sp. M361]|uniref:thioredoxin family protein n=1 Tax=Fulvivirga sp. M361 TaxID=2594266 RepID=UPI00117A0E95|nr:thioredoxin family protein [Fulvivirga sp. M361]TRX60177.1 thioredoxin family protein [Fulvivirga sp. M361]
MNKTNKFKGIILVFILISTFGFTQGIEFCGGSWEEIKALAKKENKLIFFDAYTSWCGPCKWMDKNTFLDKETGEFYNKNVIPFKQDMEKGEGPMLSKKFRITQYPTYLFIDKNEKVVHKGSGAKGPKAFIAFAKQAIDPTMRLEGLKVQYKEGNRTPEFIRRYLFALRDASEPRKEIIDWYFNYTTDEELLTAENFELIKKMAGNPLHPKFVFLEKNRVNYEKLVGAEEVEKTLYDAYNTLLVMAMYSDDVDRWEKAKMRTHKSGFEDAGKLVTRVSIYYHARNKNWDNYVTTINDYINNYDISAGDIGYYTLQVAKNDAITRKDHWTLALEWINLSIKMENKYRNNHAKAALLLKMNKPKKALKSAKTALSLATEEEKEKSYTSPTIELITKIKGSV